MYEIWAKIIRKKANSKNAIVKNKIYFPDFLNYGLAPLLISVHVFFFNVFSS